jgi:hypothetical protein
MASAPFQALLVEGTSGVGKSTLIDALIRRHVGTAAPRKIRSVVHLAQSHTYGPLAVSEDRGLTVDENLLHLERIVGAAEWLHASVQEHTRPWCFLLIDTLHLTHCVRPGVVKWRDVAPYDARLAALGCKMLFLQTSPKEIWERGIKPRMKEQFILEYAKKLGGTLEEIHEYFVREQDAMAGLFAQSAMPKLQLSSDGAAEGVLDAAHKFWSEELGAAAE